MITTNPAEDLEGVTLPPDWTVLERIDPRPGDTGGFFSINYWVENSSGTRGFCKILNYWWLLTTGALGPDPLHALAEASTIYEFERDLARECTGLSRVVTALADGTFSRPGYLMPAVHFIIFEVADGDIRRVLDEAKDIDVAARLRAVHNLATGVRQLHGREVAHQDIKPSNTLVFPPVDRHDRITRWAISAAPRSEVGLRVTMTCLSLVTQPMPPRRDCMGRCRSNLARADSRATYISWAACSLLCLLPFRSTAISRYSYTRGITGIIGGAPTPMSIPMCSMPLVEPSGTSALQSPRN